MKAFRAVDWDAPDECCIWVVFAPDETAALECLSEFIPLGHVDIALFMEAKPYIPEGLTSAAVCEDGATLLALGIVPYGWLECRTCGVVGPWDETELCVGCRVGEEEGEELPTEGHGKARKGEEVDSGQLTVYSEEMGS